MNNRKDKTMVICILLQSIALIIDSSKTQNKLLRTIHVIFMLIAGVFWIFFGFTCIKTEIKEWRITVYKIIKILIYVFLL